MLSAIERFFVSWRFPVFAVCVLVGFSAVLGGLLWVPAATDGVGAFAEQFRVWCFGEGGGQGRSAFLEYGMFFELLSLAALIALIWARPLRRQAEEAPRAFVPFMAAGGLVVVALAAALWFVGRPPPGPPSFPARELRTHLPAPRLELQNHEGQRVSLDALKGRVVVLTAVYASCGIACPMIMAQAKSVVAGLGEGADGLTVLAVTLDPAHDDVAGLAALAEAQEVAAPRFQLLTGEPAEVEVVLDRMGVERKRDPATGMIDHAKLFLLVDRAGFVAYRFTVGELQERWMREALQLLLGEPLPGPTALLTAPKGP